MEPAAPRREQPDASKGNRVRSIAIVGGGTAGWIAASVLARAIGATNCHITVVESPEIGTVGVGEATIPPIIDLLRFLSINEDDFVRHTQATYKLGIRFTDWRRLDHAYWHPFGTFGETIHLRPFHHAWQRAVAEGAQLTVPSFSLCATLGEQGKFRFPEPGGSGPVAGLRYALHFDAGLVARYLRAYAEKLGVTSLARTVATAMQRADGFIDELQFTDGSRLAADLYIDCSGFNGLLIEKTLQTGYVDWREILPCDRAVVVQTDLRTPRPPYTESTALSAGWRWHIPLQQRSGNGYVYSSAHTSDEAAHDELLRAPIGRVITDPRVIRFTTGRRKSFWNRNCVALGLASGFLEPLESTSIHLVVSGVYKLLEHFPDRDFDAHNIASYNAELIHEIERVRDFIVLHYCLTERTDSALWRYCRAMALPESLAQRIAQFRATGRLRPLPGDLFTDSSWFYIFTGMGVVPRAYDPLIDQVSAPALSATLDALSGAVSAAARVAPAHDSYFQSGNQRHSVR